MAKLVSRLCLDLQSDGVFTFTCTEPRGHSGEHIDQWSDRPTATCWPTHWPQAEPLSDRARQAVAFDTADLAPVKAAGGSAVVTQPMLSDAMASWESRRPTGAELADAVRKLDGPDDDEDDDEDAAIEPEVIEYDPGDEVDDEGGMSEYRHVFAESMDNRGGDFLW